MGLFDGAADGRASSTADVARLLRAPVVLVVDAGAMAGSVAAVVHGFATLDPAVGVAGVILNRVGSDGHETQLREALAPLGLPVLGALRRDDRLTWRDRHLGPGAGGRAARRGGAGRSTPWGRRWPSGSTWRAVMALAATAPPLRVAAPVPLPAAGAAGPGGRGRGAGVHVHLRRHRRRPGGRRRRGGPVRPAAGPGRCPRRSTAWWWAAASRRRSRPSWPPTARCWPTPPPGSGTASSPGPSAAACCGCPASWTGTPWPAWSRAGRMTDRPHPRLPHRHHADRQPGGARRARSSGATSSTTPALDPGGDALHLASRFGQGPEGFATPRLLATYVHHHPGGDPRRSPGSSPPAGRLGLGPGPAAA